MGNDIYSIFDNVLMIAIIGSILVLIVSTVLSIILLTFSSKIKDDKSQRRKTIISGIAILLVVVSGCGILMSIFTG
ncbi:TPA: hypothetical protein VB376_002407 [Staphylococcus aureus]|uniref:hypothetical protein n=1 Tax=Staphylococcus epidermidis TaxID=1282 RepID=UPI000C1921A6|nr:hypothetical protein [Staphylococcus epidermidis]MDS3952319.1 hypothetical protein [Staphylococcus epidermidis]PIH06343.1 hypothetical protein CTJ00_13185 [Staphylococcus epidermidis]HEP1288761.1 hypothetical protein [Staphylococcus aureus]